MHNKIVVVTMVKNEADIIESFVRYYMTFADAMIIVNHNSDDRTGEILTLLQKEYPSLIVDVFESQEYIQSEIMTALMNTAANELGAEWILPIDADEFLIPVSRKDTVKEILEGISENVVSLDWVNYELANPEDGADRFLLSRECKRASKPETMTKVLIKGEFVRNNSVWLYQGQHGVGNNNGGGNIAAPRVSSLEMAHFPYRSNGQYASKVVVGWLTNVLRYSSRTYRTPHWRLEFNKIIKGNLDYPRLADCSFCGRVSDVNINLRYTEAAPINVMGRVMVLAERVFSEYSEMKLLDALPEIELFLPIGKDIEAAASTIESVLKQDFPRWRLYLIPCSGLGCEAAVSVCECDERIEICDDLGKVKKSGYIKLINPGDCLDEKCIRLQAIALYNNEEFIMAYANSSNGKGGDVVVDAFLPKRGSDIWNAIKSEGCGLSGGVSGFMFRAIPEHIALGDILLGEIWDEKALLSRILPGNLMLVFNDRLIIRS